MIQKRHIDPSSPDKISVKDKLILALARSVLWVSAKLPLETARQLGRWCGRCYYATGSRIRLITERNIELAYPELSLFGNFFRIRAINWLANNNGYFSSHFL